ncbi:glucohydrolase [Actinomyces radicidentis]|uniref:Glucohydrolase n=1 Tax=Actinomyces radicidentis TaxID=111015 RepID=A0A109W7X4_ACTRD|nr:alpha,alpha-phosphotrehalase [Actinomyces radicidentis]AMD87618.1 glucohydrolase [Actinomyces radicidentis]
MSTHGFHDAVVYQVYPKSFKDSDGDGVGDLRGIIEKVPYIASLGVDYVWLNPFFPSPGHDNGYDVSDYCAIDPAMGTMEDFDELVAALAEHGISPMLDMVLNHVSTEHEWFQRALAGEQRYRDYFYIRPVKPDGSLPTNWVSKFGGPAWAPFTGARAVDPGASRQAVVGADEAAAGPSEDAPAEYYLHLYDPTQADLDWHNPEVREEAAKVVNFWRSHGVRAFRFDVINVIGKTEPLADAPAGTDDRRVYTDGPLVHELIRGLNEASFGQDPDSVTVGEMSSTSIEACVGYSRPENHELSMVFNFHHLKVDYENGQKWSLMAPDVPALKHLLNDWSLGLQDGGGWNALFWNNHDQPRAVDRFGDVERYRYESATMLATAIHLLRGTPYVYMGEEIGMTDPQYTSIGDYVDVEARNAYTALIAAGEDEATAFRTVHAKARDNARTPMQWTAGEGAGFTTGTPWLRPTNQELINVESEEAEGRILPYYKRLIALRKQFPVISEGLYEPWVLEDPDVLAYLRRETGPDGEPAPGGAAVLVLCSFRDHKTTVPVPAELAGGDVLVANRPELRPASYAEHPLDATVTLAPFEALALAVNLPTTL